MADTGCYKTLGRALKRPGSAIELCLENALMRELGAEIAHLTALKVLSLESNQRLESISPAIGNLAALVSLSISECPLLERLPEEVGDLVGLENLDLRNNALREIPCSLARLTRLRQLDLTWNRLSSLPERLPPKLRKLRLDHNHFSELLPALADLGELEELSARRQWNDGSLTAVLNALPRWVGSLSSLRRLDLSHNEIEFIDRATLDSLPPSLTWLNLSDNPLSPDSVEVLSKPPQRLEVVFGYNVQYVGPMCGCFVGFLDAPQMTRTVDVQELSPQLLDNLQNAPLLRSLTVRDALALTEFPVAITALSSLETLFLGNTLHMAHLAGSLGRMSSLRNLSLVRTGIRCLPPELCDLVNLELLEVTGGSLTALPDGISKLRRLKHLKVSDNPIAGLTDEVGTLESLETLDISNTRIRSLPNSLRSLRNLRVVFLDGLSLPDAQVAELRSCGVFVSRD